MTEAKETNGEANRVNAAEGGVGDVEAAGETTAADTISGPTDARPVGADTMVKVARSQEGAEESSEPAGDKD